MSKVVFVKVHDLNIIISKYRYLSVKLSIFELKQIWRILLTSP